MREIDCFEIQHVSGGLLKAAGAVAGILVWAFANRGALKEIKDGAVARNAELNAEHDKD